MKYSPTPVPSLQGGDEGEGVKIENCLFMNYIETTEYLKQRILEAGKELPQVVVVLGSGLGKLADTISNPLVIPYKEIPHFKVSTAVGHKGDLIVGTLGGKTVMAMQGRFHYYEGYSMEEVTYPMRVFARMGVRIVLVSNAAGAVNPTFRVGDLMVITDHINFMPNPLIGPNKEDFGPRFPDMTEAYSHRIRAIAQEEAKKLNINLREGVYAAGTGPTYETPAEYRMYGILGADACGMSTVPEVIVARHSGMEVFGMSVITNQSADLGNGVVNDGNDVVRAANEAADKMTALFTNIILNS
jgi:purine-nucleoside phosphorylase